MDTKGLWKNLLNRSVVSISFHKIPSINWGDFAVNYKKKSFDGVAPRSGFFEVNETERKISIIFGYEEKKIQFERIYQNGEIVSKKRETLPLNFVYCEVFREAEILVFYSAVPTEILMVLRTISEVMSRNLIPEKKSIDENLFERIRLDSTEIKNVSYSIRDEFLTKIQIFGNHIEDVINSSIMPSLIDKSKIGSFSAKTMFGLYDRPLSINIQRDPLKVRIYHRNDTTNEDVRSFISVLVENL